MYGLGMSAELIAIIAAAVSLGGLVTVQVAGLRARLDAIDARLRAVETELAFLRGLLQGAGIAPAPAPTPPDTGEGAAA